MPGRLRLCCRWMPCRGTTSCCTHTCRTSKSRRTRTCSGMPRPDAARTHRRQVSQRQLQHGRASRLEQRRSSIRCADQGVAGGIDAACLTAVPEGRVWRAVSALCDGVLLQLHVPAPPEAELRPGGGTIACLPCHTAAVPVQARRGVGPPRTSPPSLLTACSCASGCGSTRAGAPRNRAASSSSATARTPTATTWCAAAEIVAFRA